MKYYAYLWSSSPFCFSIISLKPFLVINLFNCEVYQYLKAVCNLSQQEHSALFKAIGYFFSNFFTYLELYFPVIFILPFSKTLFSLTERPLKIKFKLFCFFLSFFSIVIPISYSKNPLSFFFL